MNINTNEINGIGRRKYETFKKYDFDSMGVDENLQFKKLYKTSVAKAIEQIAQYEAKNSVKHSQTDFAKAYRNKILNAQPKQETKIGTQWLYLRFKECFEKNEGVKFLETAETVQNIKPLIYYFAGDLENFKKCKNVSNLSVPSLEKGFLLIGGYGNGKSSCIKALETALISTKKTFKTYTTNGLVKMYERAENPIDKKDFDRTTLKGARCFDDLLTEKEASNYGKANIMKDILEERYIHKLVTYASMNKVSNGSNLQDDIDQIGIKYGSRVYDRVLSMFNVISFNGKSFRI